MAGKFERRITMVYKWRIPGIVPVDAQTAGEEMVVKCNIHDEED